MRALRPRPSLHEDAGCGCCRTAVRVVRMFPCWSTGDVLQPQAANDECAPARRDSDAGIRLGRNRLAPRASPGDQRDRSHGGNGADRGHPGRQLRALRASAQVVLRAACGQGVLEHVALGGRPAVCGPRFRWRLGVVASGAAVRAMRAACRWGDACRCPARCCHAGVSPVLVESDILHPPKRNVNAARAKSKNSCVAGRRIAPRRSR